MANGAGKNEPWDWQHSDRPDSEFLSAILTKGHASIAIALPRAHRGSEGADALEASIRALLGDAAATAWRKA